jgi:hypothetical protein
MMEAISSCETSVLSEPNDVTSQKTPFFGEKFVQRMNKKYLKLTS